MLVNLTILIFIFLLIFNCFAQSVSRNEENYGPYHLKLHEYVKCRGPKRLNLADYTLDITQNKKGDYEAVLSVTVFTATKIEEVRISLYRKKDRDRTLLMNYKLDKPCTNFMIALIITEKVGFSNCFLKKGNFSIELNFSEMARDIVGTSFFYGEYVFRAIAIAKKGNIICVQNSATFTKR